jgi:protein-tyrosine phosphatase
MTYWIWKNGLGTINMIENNTEVGVVIVDVRDLSDNGENDVAKVKDKIQLIGNLICSGYAVVVRCQAGISRSNTIACAVMVWVNPEMYWDEAWKKVEKACPRARLNQDFYQTVKKALIELSSDRYMKDRLI